MRSEEDRLIERIYEAAVLPELWPDVLSRVCGLVGGWGGAVVTIDALQQTRFMTTERYAATYDSFGKSGMLYENKRTTRHLASRHSGFLLDLDTCSQAELDVDPIYENFLYPYGIGWTVGTLIPVPTAEMLVFDFCRRREDGPFDRRVVTWLDGLRPHLARAALIATRLKMKNATIRVETLQSFGLAAAVVALTSRKVIAANELFAALSPQLSTGAYGRLVLENAKAGELLAQAIKGLAADPVTRSIPVPASGEIPSLILHVVPLVRGAQDAFSVLNACIVAVTPVVAPRSPLAGMVMGLFDLTPAEARVTTALIGGASIAEIARKTNLSSETIRTHLKAVFAKTGVHRQIDLVRLLHSATSIT